MRSPDTGIDAVVVETNGGATTSFGYLIYVAAKGPTPARGSEVATLYAAHRSDQAYGVNLRRDSPDALVVEYSSARFADLKRPTIRVSRQVVTIELVGGVTDPSALPGGMLQNLHDRTQDR